MFKGLILVLCLTAFIFTVKSQPVPDGLYFVQSVFNGFFWDTFLLETDVVNTFDFFEDEFQAFIFIALPNGFYTITSFAFGTNLAAASSPNLEDTIFLTLPNPDDISQQFRVIRRPSGFFMIEPRIDLSQAIEPSALDGGEIFLNAKDCIGDTQQLNLIPIILGESQSLARVSNKRYSA